MTSPQTLDEHISEDDLQDLIAHYAQWCGWLVHHQRPARTNNGWRTTVQYDGKGFPDLVMARHGRVVLAEIKTETGRVSPHQKRWIAASGAHLWRPSDWPQIQEILR